MTQDGTGGEGAPGGDEAASVRRVWVRRAVLVAIALVVIVLIYLLLQAFLPRWWASRVGRQVEGTTESGVMWGGFYGFVFTAVPLLMLGQVRRNWVQWQGRIFLLVGALLGATPNWLTLAVVTGSTKSASAGRGIMDSEAPGFRAASLAGVIAAVIVVIGFMGARWLLARRNRQIANLRRRLEGDSDGS